MAAAQYQAVSTDSYRASTADTSSARQAPFPATGNDALTGLPGDVAATQAEVHAALSAPTCTHAIPPRHYLCCGPRIGVVLSEHLVPVSVRRRPEHLQRPQSVLFQRRVDQIEAASNLNLGGAA